MSSLPSDNESMAAVLAPLAQALAGVDLSDPAAARSEVESRAPFAGELIQRVREAAFHGAQEGWLLPRAAGEIKFGRVVKDLEGFSVDAVWMSGPGPRHRHPQGEIDLCFAEDGDPRFDGSAEGWVVYGPESVHVPTVRDGSMLILYFLPGGEIVFE